MTENIYEHGFGTTLKEIRSYAERLIKECAKKKGKIDTKKLKKFAVISTPRVGSTLFCESLEYYGKLGWALEWFNKIYVQSVSEVRNIQPYDIKEYVQDIYVGTTNEENHVFGVNFHVSQYIALKELGFDIFSLNFDKIYYLERGNKFKQAYSYAKSLKSGIWSKEIEIKAGYPDGMEIPINSHEFTAALADILTQIEYYKTYLKQLVTREYLFEDFIKDNAFTASQEICQDLDQPYPEPNNKRALAKKQTTDFDTNQLKKLISELEGQTELVA